MLHPPAPPTCRDKARIEKIVNSMKLKISARDSRHTDPRVHLFAICSQWLPLATAALSMVVLHMPSPLHLSLDRVEKLMCSSAKTFDSFPQQTQCLSQGECRSPQRETCSDVFSLLYRFLGLLSRSKCTSYCLCVKTICCGEIRSARISEQVGSEQREKEREG